MNIYVLNTISVGEDTIELLCNELKINGVIGLSDDEHGDKISGFSYQKKFSEKQNLNFIEVQDYNLENQNDKHKLFSLNIDVLIVLGWQRLVPKWLIDHCNICVIGSHGSPFGITKGRGRSPQNWSLIMGLDSFEISIFEIDSGIDSGRVFDSKRFSYDQFDDIRTSYYKACLLTSSMIINLLKDKNFKKKSFKEQNEKNAEYFPKRVPSDGFIDWNLDKINIFNLIRSLTKPYPGARSLINENEVIIWKGHPFKLELDLSRKKNGEIFKVFYNGDLLVKCGDGLILITEYSILGKKTKIISGDKFISFDNFSINSEIIKRHEKKYPSLPISLKLIDHIKEISLK